ncbi:MAG TPA: copper chaperone PCu(A)C [Acidimicrobiales bacterium]
MSTDSPDVAPASDADPDTLPATPERTDIYARIRRAAPLLVVLFCAGLLVVMAVLRPFPDPGAEPELRDALVGADADPTGAYVVIDNSGGSDTLLGATSPAAEQVELQQRQGATDTDPGVLVTVEELPIRGYEETRLQPGGDQILLDGLVRPLTAGDRVELTLDFERAGTVTVEAEVQTYEEIARVLLPPRLVIPSSTVPSTSPTTAPSTP